MGDIVQNTAIEHADVAYFIYNDKTLKPIIIYIKDKIKKASSL